MPYSNHEQAGTIEGILDKVVFRNEENGYTVALIQEPGKTDPTTIVGTLAQVHAGENMQLHGKWTYHPKYGRQFAFESYRVVPPSTLNGIRRYLASGAMKGIGEKMAQRLVRHFGMETLEIIEHHPERLREVPGIGKKKLQSIRSCWEKQRAQQEVMVFLQSYGVSTSQANRIHEAYGDDTISLIRSDPYRLARDIHGIGFRTADRIAQNLGVPHDAQARLDAGVIYVLDELSAEGHTCYPKEELVREAAEVLGVDKDFVAGAVERRASEGWLIIEEIDVECVYLARLHTCEVSVARRLLQLIKGRPSLPGILIEEAIAWAEKRLDLTLAQGQKDAIRVVLGNKVSIITGGPGVGKTTVVNAMLQILQAKHVKVVLAAPTGRAAKRMSESTGQPAQTIHRLLRFNPSAHEFEANEKNPLEGDVFIIDESSMIDIILMHHLLKAIPEGAHLVLVGDVDQLPSVGPGNVLRDIINSGRVAVARLDTIFRQSRRSTIVEWAHEVNHGNVPSIPRHQEGLSDLYFLEKESPPETLDLILRLCTDRIPKRFGYHPVNDIQVLTPMHKGLLGVTNLNEELQKALNPRSSSMRSAPGGFHEGDKVMQIRNNYERDVYNGDIGFVAHIDPVDSVLTVQYDERSVEYPFTALSEIVPAYAISIHKSQGSEYPAVVLPLVTQHFVLLQRNLLYTAITRARELVVIVGTRRALRIAVEQAAVRSRFTGLKQRMLSST